MARNKRHALPPDIPNRELNTALLAECMYRVMRDDAIFYRRQDDVAHYDRMLAKVRVALAKLRESESGRSFVFPKISETLPGDTGGDETDDLPDDFIVQIPPSLGNKNCNNSCQCCKKLLRSKKPLQRLKKNSH